MDDQIPIDSESWFKKKPLLWTYLLIGLVALVVVASMEYIFYTGTQMAAVHSPLTDAVMELQLETTIGHLQFEELISGDRNESLEAVLAHLDKADWYAKAMLEGGQSDQDKFIPLKDTHLRWEITEARSKLAEFRKATLERWQAREQPEIRAETDRRYDMMFKDLINLTDRVEAQLWTMINRNLQRFRTMQITLMIVCLGITVVVGRTLGSFVSSRIRRERKLQALNRQLTASEQVLRESEEKYRTFIESSHDFIFSKDAEGRYQTVNLKTAIGLGRSCLEDVIGKTDYELLPKEQADALRKTDKKVMESGRDIEAEEVVGVGDKQLYALSHKWPKYDKQGKIDGIRCVGMDITERKQAEMSLCESEEKFRSVAEQSIVGFLIMQDSKFEYVNEAVSEILEYPVKEMLSWEAEEGLAKIVHPNDAAFVMEQQRRKQAGENGVFVHYAWKALTKFGRTRYVDTYWKWILYRHRPADLITMIDITERDRAERAIKESEQQYKELVESIDGIVWECDAQTFQFTFVSRNAEKLLSYPLGRWIDEPMFWADHLHEDDRQWAVEFCKRATAERRNHSFEYRMIAADNRIVWLRDVVHVVVENGEAVKLRGVMVDITEYKKAKRKA